MKRYLFRVVIVLVLVAALIGGKYQERTTYAQSALVVDIDGESVTVETATGNLFAFYGSEDFDIGDLVSMVMDDNRTPETVIDDLILSASYSGFRIER